MSQIITIAKREVTRLRTRFTGKSKYALVAIILLAIVIGYVVYNQDIAPGRHLYTVGVSPDAPPLADDRFNVRELSPESGYEMVVDKSIDVYLHDSGVVSRKDDRSQYALGALKRYLERQEIFRISEIYEIDEAFPLRLEIRHLATKDEGGGDGYSLSLRDILEPQSPEPGDTPEPGMEPGERDASEESGEEVKRQLDDFRKDNGVPEFQAEFAPDREILVPSLSRPPLPMSQILLAFFYVIPIFMVGIFFTSSFMEEKINRKLVVLMSAPVTPFQVIAGKMLPYILYSLLAVVVITVVLGGSLPLSLAIFLPVSLFIFSALVMVALLYRTFKDQTFFSIMAAWVTIAYLVTPAMFIGISDVSYFSPLTLAVQMYRGETFGFTEYLLATLPLYLLFAVTMFVGVRIFNEEYLMGFRPLHRKLAEAIYLVMNKSHPGLSVFSVSLLLIPVVLMIQFASIVIGLNLDTAASLAIIFVFSILAEELAKSGSIAVLIQSGDVRTYTGIIKLSFFSALGFLIGEKLLLYLTLSVVSKNMFIEAALGAGFLFLPFILHLVTTSIVCLLTARFGLKYYPLAILAGSVVHCGYNLIMMAGEIF